METGNIISREHNHKPSERKLPWKRIQLKCAHIPERVSIEKC